MKKFFSILILAALVACFAYCKSKKNSVATTTPAPATVTAAAPSASSVAALQLEIAQRRWPNTTATEIQEGDAIFHGKCIECHKAYAIARFNEFKWLHEIDDMSPKARLTAAEKQNLTRYVLSYREMADRSGK